MFYYVSFILICACNAVFVKLIRSNHLVSLQTVGHNKLSSLTTRSLLCFVKVFKLYRLSVAILRVWRVKYFKGIVMLCCLMLMFSLWIFKYYD